MNDRILHSCGDYDNMYRDSNKTIKGNFNCPCCDGIITRREVRKPRESDMVNLSILSNPYCTTCGREFSILINKDLSYEITQN